MGILIEEEILITHYQRWLINKLKEHSRSRRVSSLPQKSYRPKKLQPALDTTKKSGSVSISRPVLYFSRPASMFHINGVSSFCLLVCEGGVFITANSFYPCIGFKTPVEASEGSY